MVLINCKKGFSLIELMVVVAIMAIIALVAVPSYQSFTARARQKEGLALLNTYYAAAQATRAEYGAFPGEFVETGFAPTGQLGYRLEARNNAPVNLNLNGGVGPAIADNACIGTDQACNCGGNCPDFKTWTEKPLGVLGTSRGPFTISAACGALAGIGVTDNTFSIRVAAIISTATGVGPDRWGMDEGKQLVQCSDGTM